MGHLNDDYSMERWYISAFTVHCIVVVTLTKPLFYVVHTVTDGIIIIFGDEIKTAVLLKSMIPMQKVKEHVLSPDQNESSQVLTCHGL